MSVSKLRRFVSAMAPQGEAVYIDPEAVTSMHAAGLPGCTTIHCGESSLVVVLGNPDDVYAALNEVAAAAEGK